MTDRGKGQFGAINTQDILTVNRIFYAAFSYIAVPYVACRTIRVTSITGAHHTRQLSLKTLNMRYINLAPVMFL